MWFQLPTGTTRISVAGQEFSCDDDGKFEAPDEHEAALTAAGIMPTSPPLVSGEEPVAEEPAADEPVEEEVAKEEPASEESAAAEPASEESAAEKPSEPA